MTCFDHIRRPEKWPDIVINQCDDIRFGNDDDFEGSDGDDDFSTEADTEKDESNASINAMTTKTTSDHKASKAVKPEPPLSNSVSAFNEFIVFSICHSVSVRHL